MYRKFYFKMHILKFITTYKHNRYFSYSAALTQININSIIQEISKNESIKRINEYRCFIRTYGQCRQSAASTAPLIKKLNCWFGQSILLLFGST